MKLIIIGILVALMALGTSCAQISQPVAEVAPQATSDGIQVHGHWTVTVTNPDGTVDAVHEFENALIGSGKALLSTFLVSPTINIDQSKWSITLGGNPFLGTSFSEGFDCAEQRSMPDTQMLVYLPANVELLASSSEKSVTIRATCLVEKADTGTSITNVRTRFKTTESFQAMGLVYHNEGTFSRKDFPPEKYITPIVNQIIAFNVVISFE